MPQPSARTPKTPTQPFEIRFPVKPDFLYQIQVTKFPPKPAGALFNGRITMNKRGYLDSRKEITERMREVVDTSMPLQCVRHLDFYLYSVDRRSDLSNVIEGILDAGKGVIWVDDRKTNIPSVSYRFVHTPKSKLETLYLAIWV